jgi:hypothetical protein
MMEGEKYMVLIILRLLILTPLIGVLVPVSAGHAQSQMPDQRTATRMVAGAGLTRKGLTMSLSVPVSATNGGAGTVSGILKGNGSGIVTAAASGFDYAPATSGTALLKGNGAGGFTSAVNGTDYAPATSGSSILKGSGGGAFANAVSGIDYAPPTTSNAILKGNGSGGFANAISSSDFAPPPLGTLFSKLTDLEGFPVQSVERITRRRSPAIVSQRTTLPTRSAQPERYREPSRPSAISLAVWRVAKCRRLLATPPLHLDRQ